MKKKIWKMIKRAEGFFLDILYPKSCPFCGLISREGICENCRGLITRPKPPLCKICGKPLRPGAGILCNNCRGRQRYFEEGRSLFVHKPPVSDALYRMKYGNARCYAVDFAGEAVSLFGEEIRSWKPDVILPIPIHKSREKERGYNQADLLVKELSELLWIPADYSYIIRTKKTAPQKSISGEEREENVRGAFAVINKEEKYQRVLLVDDIYTTGSTISSAAKILKESGVKKVYFLTVSIGTGY